MGIAYLPDGTRIDYNEYIRSHPHWQAVRKARFEFDNGQCVICHKSLTIYETHHVSYDRLGHERLRDVLTMCPSCHTVFHNNWQRQKYWKGHEPNHWTTYNLNHTALLCLSSYKEDRFICKDPEAPNLCNRDVCRQYVDDYFTTTGISTGVVIDPNDLLLFVRNKRYELWFEAEDRGLTVEEFLDEYYGPKVRGKNPIRVEAGKKNGPFDHTPKAFRYHYSENKNLNMLMQMVEDISKEEIPYEQT